MPREIKNPDVDLPTKRTVKKMERQRKNAYENEMTISSQPRSKGINGVENYCYDIGDMPKFEQYRMIVGEMNGTKREKKRIMERSKYVDMFKHPSRPSECGGCSSKCDCALYIASNM